MGNATAAPPQTEAIISDQRHSEAALANDITVQRRTVDLIIEVMDKLMRGGDYEVTMRDVLETLSSAIHADRIYILEMRRRLGGRYVEWCKDGVRPRIEELFKISDGALRRFVLRFKGTDLLMASSLDELGVKDELELGYFRSYGVESIFSLALYENGRFVGCLAADNYSIDPGIDLKRLIDTIGPCMATAISNHQLLEELEWSGTHDSLTGILNRPGIDAAASELVEKGPDTPFALALVDIDDFKAVNDLYGHAAGDEALINLASSLEESLPEGSIIGRNGGDEVLVILIGDAVQMAGPLLGAFASTPITFTTGGKRASITCSIGFATYPDQAQSLSEVSRLADAALYSAKLSGKAQAARYSEKIDFSSRSQLGFTSRDIADNAPCAVAVYRPDENGTILFCNSMAAEMCGCKDIAEFLEYSKGSYRSIIHPDDEHLVENEAAERIASSDDGIFSVDFRIVTKDGTIKKVAQNGHYVENDGMGPVVYAIFIDFADHAGLAAKE